MCKGNRQQFPVFYVYGNNLEKIILRLSPSSNLPVQFSSKQFWRIGSTFMYISYSRTFTWNTEKMLMNPFSLLHQLLLLNLFKVFGGIPSEWNFYKDTFLFHFGVISIFNIIHIRYKGCTKQPLERENIRKE